MFLIKKKNKLRKDFYLLTWRNRGAKCQNVNENEYVSEPLNASVKTWKQKQELFD